MLGFTGQITHLPEFFPAAGDTVFGSLVPVTAPLTARGALESVRSVASLGSAMWLPNPSSSHTGPLHKPNGSEDRAVNRVASHPRRRGALRTAGVAVAVTVLLSSCVHGKKISETTGTTRRLAGTVPAGAPFPQMPAGQTTLEGVAVRLSSIGKLDTPTSLAPREGYPNLYVSERAGRVRQITVNRQIDNDGNVRRTDWFVERGWFLDISRDVGSTDEGGLLGITFSIDGRRLFTAFSGRDGSTLEVVEFPVEEDRVDTSQRRGILSIPGFRGDGHYGGSLAIGSDGYLYVAVGDGGGAGDPDRHAQDPHSLLGKILRIDPEGRVGDAPYAIPPANPFQDGVEGAAEVWAWGLRDPLGLSFDRNSHDLWLVDRGEGRGEEVDYVPSLGAPSAGRGANFGWPIMLGTRPNTGAAPPNGNVPPVLEYNHDHGECDVRGGRPYNGTAIPGLTGAYVFGDACLGEIQGLIASGAVMLDHRDLGAGTGTGNLAAIGNDNNGELWVLANSGEIFRVDPA